MPPEIKDEIISFDQTVVVPRQLVSVRSGLDAKLVERVRELLVGLDQTDEGRQILEGLKKTTKFDPLPPDSLASLGELNKLITLTSSK